MTPFIFFQLKVKSPLYTKNGNNISVANSYGLFLGIFSECLETKILNWYFAVNHFSDIKLIRVTRT